jgi:hypothetical protein
VLQRERNREKREMKEIVLDCPPENTEIMAFRGMEPIKINASMHQ